MTLDVIARAKLVVSCKLNCDAESVCTCPAHELYRLALGALVDAATPVDLTPWVFHRQGCTEGPRYEGGRYPCSCGLDAARRSQTEEK